MLDSFDWNIAAAAIFGLFVLYFLSRAFYRPLKLIFKGLINVLIGGAAIFLYNLLAAMWGATLGLNVVTALVVGIMGLPGLGMLIALQYVLG